MKRKKLAKLAEKTDGFLYAKRTNFIYERKLLSRYNNIILEKFKIAEKRF